MREEVNEYHIGEAYIEQIAAGMGPFKDARFTLLVPLASKAEVSELFDFFKSCCGKPLEVTLKHVTKSHEAATDRVNADGASVKESHE
jgi:hypothetical protein